MKLTTEPGALAAAVKFAAHALTARAAYPILGGLQITTGEGTVEVAAFDGDTSARACITAETGEPGTVLVPGRLLAAICGQLPRRPPELATSDNGLTLSCGSTRYTLRLLPADEYPALPELAGPAGQADGGEFAAAAGQVITAASRDDTLPALGTVHVTFTSDALMLAATDRYRAALRRLPWQPGGSPLPPPILVPAPALAEAARAAGQDAIRLHVITADDGVPAVAGFASGLRTVTTRLTAADYPALASKIPGQFTAVVVTGSAELTEAVKRLAIVADRETPIHLAFTPGQLELRAGSGDEATASDTVPAELDGDPVTIAFHPRRLLDALASVGADRTRIALTGPRTAALITPATGDDSDAGGHGGADAVYRHLLMPIRTAG